jgi:hypothetical protein
MGISRSSAYEEMAYARAQPKSLLGALYVVTRILSDSRIFFRTIQHSFPHCQVTAETWFF